MTMNQISLYNRFADADLIFVPANFEYTVVPGPTRKPRSQKRRLFKAYEPYFNDGSLAAAFMDASTDDDAMDIMARDLALGWFPCPAALTRAERSFFRVRRARDAHIQRVCAFLAAQSLDAHNHCCKRRCLVVVEAPHQCFFCSKLPACLCACVTRQNKFNRLERQKTAQRKREFLASQKRVIHFRRELDRAKQTRQNLSRMHAQMFDGISAIPANINKSLNGFTGITDRINAFIDKLASTFSLPEGVDLTSVSLAGFAAVSALFGKNWLAAAASLAALARLLHINWNHWYELIVSAITGFTAPSREESLRSQMFETLFAAASAIQVVGAVAVTGISLLCGAGKPDYPGILKHLGDFGRAAVGWTKATELFNWLVTFFKDAYYRYTLGKSLEEVNMEKAYPQLISVLKRCEILRGSDFKAEYLDRDTKLCLLVSALEDEIISLKFDALRARQTDLVAILTTEAQRLNTTFIAARNSAAFANATRPAPTTLWMYGRAGVGKSNLLNYMKHEIYKRKYVDDTEWTLNNVAHTRCADNEYWDGIIPGQPIVVYDDIMQKKDTINLPNPEIMEIIRIKNESAYHLHMSNVADKKNYYFSSAYVLATTNVQIPEPVSIADPNAFTRRWDLAIEVKVNPGYGKPSADNTYQILDQAKVAAATATSGEAFNKDVYLIDIYNLADGTIIDPDLTLDAFLTRFFSTSDTILAASRDLSDSMQRQCGLQEKNETASYSAFYQKLTSQSKDGLEEVKLDDTDDEYSDAESESDEDDSVVGLLSRLYWNENNKPVIIDPKEKEKEEPLTFVTLLARPKKVVVSFSEWATTRYEKLALSEQIKAAITWTGEQMKKLKGLGSIATWLYNLLTTPSFSEYMTIISMALTSYAIGSLLFGCFKRRNCAIYHADTMEVLRFSDKCASGCDFCPTLLTGSNLGTFSYGMELLSALSLYYPNDEKAYLWNVLRAMHNTAYLREAAVQQMSDARNLLSWTSESPCVCKMVSESKEIVTRAPPRSYLAESKEIMTRVAPARLLAEMSKRPVGVSPSEYVVPGPIYDTKDTVTEMRSQMHDVVQLEQWESTTFKNTVTLYWKGTRVNGVFLTGRTLLTVYHFMKCMQDREGKMIVIPPNQTTGNTVLLSHCAITQCTDFEGKPIDLAIVTIPDQPSRPSILSKFTSANQLICAADSDFVVSGIRPVKDVSCVNNFHGSNPTIHNAITYSSPLGPMRVHQTVHYELDTKEGDCGMLVWTKDSRCAGKIFGMHVAGYNGNGAACALSREFVERNLNQHIDTCKVENRMLVDARVPFSAEMNHVEIVDKVPKDTLTKMGNCLSLGMLATPFASSKTQLRPSLVSGVLQEPTTKPAYLRTMTVDGKLVDPLLKGVAKVMNVTEPLDPELLDVVVEDVGCLHAWASIPSKTKEVLDYATAITGLDGSDYITPLNRKSSPGYPYTLDNKGPGKREWFGYDDYKINPDIEKDVNDLIDLARKNTRGDVVWVATLKDERRPIEKVNSGKTRVFTAGPMHYTIAVRMYFLRFVEHVMKNRIHNEIGVGTNVYSLDWHKTGEALSRFGPHVIAGDFSNYDGSLLQGVLWKILDIINAWYDDGPENAQIRSVLFEEICSARVLVRGELIQWDHSQPSGNPLTVIVNSLFNQIIMRYAYMLIKKTSHLPLVCDFDQHVSMQTYGDDNVLNIDPETLEWYNQITITEALATVGMTYTDEGKTGNLVKARTLPEIAYLKRRFVRDQFGFFRAPLEIGVCKEMTNWIRGLNGPGKDATLENVLASTRELYYHGKETFDENRNKLQRAVREVGIKGRLPTYFELESADQAAFFANKPISYQ